LTAIILWSVGGLYSCIVLAWLAGTSWVRKFRADETMRIEPEPGAIPDGNYPSLMVYVAAHNEAERIEACIERLLSQNYPNLNITIVNDRSDDDTSAVVRRMMHDNGRIQLVEVDQLPDGWIGKTHALSVATQKPNADYLLFVDCDCQLVPGAVQAIMHKVTREGLEFVSLWPMLDLASPSEKLITPPVSWLLGLYTLLGTKGAADGSQVVLGNGQFMLFSRSAYEQVGGHASVQAELAEDIILARKVEQLGVKRWVGWGKGIYLSQRDNNLRTTSNATTRVVIGSLVHPLRVFHSSHVILGGVGTSMFLGLPAAIVMWIWPEFPQLKLIAIGAVVHLLAMRYCIRRLFKMTFLKVPSVLAFALGGIVTGLVILRASWIITGRGTVRWGKTHYRVRGSRIVAAVPAPVR